MFGPCLSFAGGEILFGCIARRDTPGVAVVQDCQCPAKHLIHGQPKTTM